MAIGFPEWVSLRNLYFTMHILSSSCKVYQNLGEGLVPIKPHQIPLLADDRHCQLEHGQYNQERLACVVMSAAPSLLSFRLLFDWESAV